MRALRVILALLLVGYLLTSFTSVRTGERAVVRRFGRVLDEKPEPGLWVGLPWGMDRVDRVAVGRVRSVDIGYRENADEGETNPPGQLLTGDHNLVNLRFVLQYRVRPEAVEDYVAQVDDMDSLEQLLGLAAESLVADWISNRSVDEVLLHGKAELPRWLADAPDRRLEKRLGPYRVGVEIMGATVTYLAPPGDVKDAFDRVTEAQAGIRTQINTAESRARELLRQKESEKFSKVQRALAYAQEQRLQAEAEASAFGQRLARYRQDRQQNPGILAAIWWDQMSELFQRLRANGRLDLLDHHLGADGLDLMQVPPLPGGEKVIKSPNSPTSR